MKIEKDFVIFLNGFWAETKLMRRAAYKTVRPARA
jgi:hypothetical protein